MGKYFEAQNSGDSVSNAVKSGNNPGRVFQIYLFLEEKTMKRKILASLMCLLMMALILPVSGMEVESLIGENVLVNGDFEIASEEKPVLPEGWTAFAGGQLVQEDALAGNNAYYMKSSGTTTTTLSQKLTMLSAGKRYMLEGYVNLKKAVDKGVRVYIHQNGSTKAGMNYSNTVANPTDGYTKISYLFTGGENYELVISVLGDGTEAYFDNFAIYETDNLVKYEGGMDRLNSDLVADISSWKQYTGISDEIMKPYVDKTEGFNNYTAQIVSMSNSEVAAQYPLDLYYDNVTVQNSDILKVKYRVKVLSSAVQAEDITLTIRTQDTKTANINYALPVVIPKDKVNTWMDVEIILPRFSYAWFTRHATCDYLLDDFEVSKLKNSGISDKKLISRTEFPFPETVTPAMPMRVVSIFESVASVNTSDVIYPYVYYVNSTETETKATSLVAVYKKEGATKQLLGLAIEGISSKSGIPGFFKQGINLSQYEMVAKDGVTYTLESYLLNGANLEPLVKNTKLMIAPSQGE